jgi:hypothetical protein
MDYVDSIVRSAVQGIVQVGEVDIGEAQEAAAAAVQQNVASQRMRNRMPGMPPPSVPFGRSERSLFRRAPLGFPDLTIAANSSQSFVTQQVSRVFHPDRLVVIPSAPGIVIDSIRVGDEEQTVTPGTPVELYGTQALTDTLPDNFSPVQTGTTVTVMLRNTTGAPIDVTMGMKGGVQR